MKRGNIEACAKIGQMSRLDTASNEWMNHVLPCFLPNGTMIRRGAEGNHISHVLAAHRSQGVVQNHLTLLLDEAIISSIEGTS